MKHSYVMTVFWKLHKKGKIKGTFHGLRHGFAFFLKQNVHLPAEKIPDAILENVNTNTKGHIRDDIFFIIAEIK